MKQEMTLKEYVGVLPVEHMARKEFDDLLTAQVKLDALEGAGVDNWEGYDIAMQSIPDSPDSEG
jgi:hypothetical protein